ncbi:MAG: phospholipase D family protein [Prevotellaceae bacterium]|jgi:phosphatidylserine/phosphatidylglycerophosphate/cardiolipin synthase-like enzyme|nr:phospholipase D family protein [Prevotellaceae bacterium]
MAKYLCTTSVTSNVEDIIKDAKKVLYLVSPFIDLTDRFKKRLEDKEKEGVEICIIYGKNELKKEVLDFLLGLKCVSLYYSENLHAKCYFNEDKMVISSMNLYEYSQHNNDEMGVLIHKDEDENLYNDAFKDVESYKFHAESKSKHKIKLPEVKPKVKSAPSGYCIRTGVEIPFDVKKPLSDEAYKSWKKYGDPDYPEKYCHFSGEPSKGETSVNKPILKKNWSKAKEVFKL